MTGGMKASELKDEVENGSEPTERVTTIGFKQQNATSAKHDHSQDMNMV